jgi:ATP-binding cassette subfamily B protein
VQDDHIRARIGQVVYLVGSVVMLVLLDVRLFLVGLLALPAAIWALMRYRRRLEGSVAVVRDRSAGVGTFLIEALQGRELLVAHDASGLEWFECGGHGPTDNVAGVKRTELESIGTWFARMRPEGKEGR